MSYRDPNPEENPNQSGKFQITDQPETIDLPDNTDRNTPPNAQDPTRFNHDEQVPSRETASAGRAPLMATGMFLPVVILLVVAVVVILWLVL